jgi:hypothetical protein
MEKIMGDPLAKSELVTKATAALNEEVQKELEFMDPDADKVRAILELKETDDVVESN